MSQVATLFGRATPVVADDLQIARFDLASDDAWPDKRSAVVVTQGCPWSCTYCHTPELQDGRAAGAVAWRSVRTELARLGRAVDAVVFSGGEATSQRALIPAMQEARGMGYQVGLRSSGAYPARLREALGHVDWLALDIKAMPEGYHDITGKGASGAKAWESLEAAIQWGGHLEVRLTIDPTTHTREAVLSVIRRVLAMGGPMPLLVEARLEGTTPEFRHALGMRGMDDVVTPDDLAEFAATV